MDFEVFLLCILSFFVPLPPSIFLSIEHNAVCVCLDCTTLNMLLYKGPYGFILPFLSLVCGHKNTCLDKDTDQNQKPICGNIFLFPLFSLILTIFLCPGRVHTLSSSIQTGWSRGDGHAGRVKVEINVPLRYEWVLYYDWHADISMAEVKVEDKPARSRLKDVKVLFLMIHWPQVF